VSTNRPMSSRNVLVLAPGLTPRVARNSVTSTAALEPLAPKWADTWIGTSRSGVHVAGF
jgi:hypothetical protein